MLIVIGGLPGTGKTTIGRELVSHWSSVYLRIDTIEHALRTTCRRGESIGPEGYFVAYELAKSNLALGMRVVADCVNPLAITREAWRAVAASASSLLLEVEIVCSDLTAHRRRVEGREADIPGFVLPTWDAIMHHDYEEWGTEHLVIDSAFVSASVAAEIILDRSLRLAASERR